MFPMTLPTTSPVSITTGADGNLWFTEAFSNKIGRLTPSGTLTEFTNAIQAGDDFVGDIAKGPDGNVWFVSGSGVAEITPSGAITQYGPFGAGIGVTAGLTTGPDGNLWLGLGSATQNWVGKVSPTGTLLAKYAIPSNVGVVSMTAGPDGSMWFTEATNGKIARVTLSGVIVEFTPPSASGGNGGITVWSDGNLWFIGGQGGIPAVNHIDRITPAGVITEFGIPNTNAPIQITVGSDGNLWIADTFQVIKMLAPGSYLNYSIVGANNLGAIVAGPDGNIWFANTNGHTIGKLTIH